MKRIISVVLIVIMVTSLAACSGERVGDDQDVSTTAPEDSFVSDWKEGEKNTVGNSVWNLDSLSIVAEQGQWTYYFANRELYKEDHDGNKYTLASEIDGTKIQVIGDWIYFYNSPEQSISRIKTDGSELSQGPSAYVFYVTAKGIIYVTEKQVSATTYQTLVSICDLDFENHAVLFRSDSYKAGTDGRDVIIDFIGIYKNKLYFSMHYEEGDYRWNLTRTSVGLHFVDLEKKTVEFVTNSNPKLWIGAKKFLVDNYIYICDHVIGLNNKVSKMYKVNIDTLQETIVMKSGNGETTCVMAYDKRKDGENMFVVVMWNKGICAATEKEMLLGTGRQITPDAGAIALTKNYIYYKVGIPGNLYRIDYSGENWEKLGTIIR